MTPEATVLGVEAAVLVLSVWALAGRMGRLEREAERERAGRCEAVIMLAQAGITAAEEVERLEARLTRLEARLDRTGPRLNPANEIND